MNRGLKPGHPFVAVTTDVILSHKSFHTLAARQFAWYQSGHHLHVQRGTIVCLNQTMFDCEREHTYPMLALINMLNLLHIFKNHIADAVEEEEVQAGFEKVL